MLADCPAPFRREFTLISYVGQLKTYDLRILNFILLTLVVN